MDPANTRKWAKTKSISPDEYQTSKSDVEWPEWSKTPSMATSDCNTDQTEQQWDRWNERPNIIQSDYNCDPIELGWSSTIHNRDGDNFRKCYDKRHWCDWFLLGFWIVILLTSLAGKCQRPSCHLREMTEVGFFHILLLSFS